MMGGWNNMMGGWGYGGYGSGYGMMGMAGIGMHLIFGIGIILLGIYLFRRNTPRVHSLAVGKDSAMDILRERYAQGEIDSEEFQIRKRDLESK